VVEKEGKMGIFSPPPILGHFLHHNKKTFFFRSSIPVLLLLGILFHAKTVQHQYLTPKPAPPLFSVRAKKE
jgi:hypothetical protein